MDKRVSEVMNPPVVGVEPSGSVADAAKLMLGSHISGLPVVTADGHQVGIVSEGDFLWHGEIGTARKIKRVPVVDKGEFVGIAARSDLMRAMLRSMPASAQAANEDERILQAIAEELAKQPSSSAIRTKVDRGIAGLSDAIFDERAREAARVAAENVPGVKSVKDWLAWIEPMSGIYMLPETSNQAQCLSVGERS